MPTNDCEALVRLTRPSEPAMWARWDGRSWRIALNKAAVDSLGSSHVRSTTDVERRWILLVPVSGKAPGMTAVRKVSPMAGGGASISLGRSLTDSASVPGRYSAVEVPQAVFRHRLLEYPPMPRGRHGLLIDLTLPIPRPPLSELMMRGDVQSLLRDLAECLETTIDRLPRETLETVRAHAELPAVLAARAVLPSELERRVTRDAADLLVSMLPEAAQAIEALSQQDLAPHVRTSLASLAYLVPFVSALGQYASGTEPGAEQAQRILHALAERVGKISRGNVEAAVADHQPLNTDELARLQRVAEDLDAEDLLTQILNDLEGQRIASMQARFREVLHELERLAAGRSPEQIVHMWIDAAQHLTHEQADWLGQFVKKLVQKRLAESQ